jgi:hypothetical protein
MSVDIRDLARRQFGVHSDEQVLIHTGRSAPQCYPINLSSALGIDRKSNFYKSLWGKD